MKPIETILKEFDEKFGHKAEYKLVSRSPSGYTEYDPTNEIKSFITNLHQSTINEVCDIAEKQKPKDFEPDTDYERGYFNGSEHSLSTLQVKIKENI